MALPLLPLTYDEMRARFRLAVHRAGLSIEVHPIDARGPEGQELTVDVAAFGPGDAPNALIVLSGVHGVEAPVASALQCDLVDRLDELSPPDNLRIVLVHGVNPWGMAWWRRANENNVDLNRNWNRDHVDPPVNEGYQLVHPLLCPDTATVPTLEEFREQMMALVTEHGRTWMRDVISVGQFTHADGFYFGGDRTEQSTRILADVVARHAAAAVRSLSVDVHTGHGPHGTHTLLTGARVGTPNDRWIRHRFTADEISGRARSSPEGPRGHLGAGLADVLTDSEHRSVVLEFGTRSTDHQVVTTRLENWVHHHGDRGTPEGVDIIVRNRRNYTPDDPEWATNALDQGRAVLDDALRAFEG